MNTVKIGIFGLGRGSSFYNSILLNNGEIVAVCDRREEKLEEASQTVQTWLESVSEESDAENVPMEESKTE